MCSYRERVRSGAGEKVWDFGVVFNTAELADIVEDQCAVVEFENGARIFGSGTVPEKFTRHAKVDVENAAVELGEDLFAATANALNSCACEGFGGGVKIRARDTV